MNDFNFVAPFYDPLSRLVFGGSLIQSQCHFLSEIQEQSSVLIIGGGTGKILEFLSCKEVMYLEKSSRMIARAKRRRTKAAVTFEEQDVLNYRSDRCFDVILCPFVLDCFGAPCLMQVLSFCRDNLRENGSLIVTDFRKNGKNEALIRTMYAFFRIASNIEATSLHPLERQIEEVGWSKCKSKYFLGGSVFSSVYERAPLKG